nr:cupin domain-containing protein [Bacteroidales bacterium]
MKKEKIFFDSNSYTWEDVAPGVSRQITGYNDEIMMVLVKFEDGAVGAKHS